MLPLVKLLMAQAVTGPSAAMYSAWALSSIASHSPRAVSDRCCLRPPSMGQRCS